MSNHRDRWTYVREFLISVVAIPFSVLLVMIVAASVTIGLYGLGRFVGMLMF